LPGGIPGLIVGAGIAVHLVYLASLHLGWLNRLFNDSSHTGQGFDFAVYYLAGQAVQAGRDVYGIEAGFGFRYLPAFAHLVARGFSFLPAPTAYLVYLGITELVLAADLWLTCRWVPEGGIRRATVLFLWLTSTPLYLELYIGQVSFWAASLLYLLLWTVASGRTHLGAAAWIAAVLVKPNALILGPAFLRQRRWWAVAACAAVVIGSSLPHFLAYPGSWAAFRAANLETGGVQGALTHAGNLGLWGALVSVAAKAAGLPLAGLSTLADLPLWGRLLVLSGPVVALGGAALATLRTRHADPLLPYTLWLTTFFLVYKDVWEHHYVFLLPVLAVLYHRTGQPWLLVAFAAVALPTPFFLLDLSPGVKGPIDPERSWDLATSLFYRCTKLVPVAVLWGWQVRRLLQPERHPK
jgi:hypothetical protein